MIQPGAVPVVLAPVQPPQPRNLPASRKLAVVQLLIGILAVILGILSFPLLHTRYGISVIRPGIWSGGWILITGSIGIRSTRNNNSLNYVYMVFNIISTCITGIAIIIVGIILGAEICCYYCQHNCASGLGLFVPLVIILIIEFFVSIIASVFCCQNSSCCQQPAQVIIQQQSGQNAFVAYPQQHQMMMQPGYPQQQQIMLQPGYSQQQQIMMQPGHPQQQCPQMYTVQYGAQAPPYSTQPQHAEGAPSAHGPIPNVGYDQPPAYSDKPSGL